MGVAELMWGGEGKGDGGVVGRRRWLAVRDEGGVGI